MLEVDEFGQYKNKLKIFHEWVDIIAKNKYEVDFCTLKEEEFNEKNLYIHMQIKMAVDLYSGIRKIDLTQSTKAVIEHIINLENIILFNNKQNRRLF